MSHQRPINLLILLKQAKGHFQQEGTACGIRGLQTSSAAQQQPVPAPEMIEVFVNDQALQIPKGSTVMQACDAAGVDIPRYNI